MDSNIFSDLFFNDNSIIKDGIDKFKKRKQVDHCMQGIYDEQIDNGKNDFQDFSIRVSSGSEDEYLNYLERLVFSKHAPVDRGTFVGHMTTPNLSLFDEISRLITILNQNVVKVETSSSLTLLERELIGKFHHLVYQKSEGFYGKFLQSRNHFLGVCCSGGTIANLTALWIATSNAFCSNNGFVSVKEEGLIAALKRYSFEGVAIFVSRLGHYSLRKSAEILGIGSNSIVDVEYDCNYRICISDLEKKISEARDKKFLPLAIVGLAGSTETGSVDSLIELYEVAQKEAIHFHIDAAWGGAFLLSREYKERLAGIHLADTVTIDPHKQMYVPIGSGILVLKDPEIVQKMEINSNYIVKKGSFYLGRFGVEGSRPANALYLNAAFNIYGKKLFEDLLNHSMHMAKKFYEIISAKKNLRVVSMPELNILTYHYIPDHVMEGENELLDNFTLNEVNKINCDIHRIQLGLGNSLVSMTSILDPNNQMRDTCVFRVVMSNPMTTEYELYGVVKEQLEIAKDLLQNISRKDQQETEA